MEPYGILLLGIILQEMGRHILEMYERFNQDLLMGTLQKERRVRARQQGSK
jgi:hypothetical protein